MERRWNPERTRDLIEKRGLTRKFIAQNCGLKSDSLDHILAGRKPGAGTLILMAQVLQTSVDYLVGKTTDARPKEVSVA